MAGTIRGYSHSNSPVSVTTVVPAALSCSRELEDIVISWLVGEKGAAPSRYICAIIDSKVTCRTVWNACGVAVGFRFQPPFMHVHLNHNLPTESSRISEAAW